MTDKRKRIMYAYLFFAPFALFFTVFRAVPFLEAVGLVFYQWDILTPPKFIGLQNFQKVFADKKFWSSLWHTLYFTILTVPPLVIFGFLLATLVHAKIKWQGFFRSAFYLPNILSISVVCLTWGMLYNNSFGPFNGVLKFLGLPGVKWTGDVRWAMLSIAGTTVWWTLGFNFLVYLAGLQQISPSYYEASEIDGANGWQNLWYLTLPLLKRSHILVIVLQVVASLQIFGQVLLLTAGGPSGRTRVLVQYIYETGFRYFKMGYAQTMAFLFFILMLAVSYLQIRLLTGKED